MNCAQASLLALLLAAAPSSEAFSPRLPTSTSVLLRPSAVSYQRGRPHFASTSALPDNENDEIKRLKEMAAKLRQEAAGLEAEQKQAFAAAAEQIFRRFDVNNDGKVSAPELKQGLEKVLKIELSETRANQLVDAFDTNQDGSLQLEEFSGVDVFRNKLDALVRQERQEAREKAKAAQAESEAAKLTEVQMSLVNDKPPTVTDKVISVLPYLFPLVDGLQFGRFFIEGNPENPLATAALIAYAAYRTIPLSGFLSFLTLNVLSNNPKLNKLVRFNMQQAVYLDVALFAPALLVSLSAGLLNQLGVAIPASATELGNDVTFLALLATIGYASVTSLTGQLPNKLPFISQRVENTMLTPDMYDPEGRFRPFDDDGNLKGPTKKEDDDGRQ